MSPSLHTRTMLLSHDRTWATDSSDDNWKHSVSEWTDDDALLQLAYIMPAEILLLTYLLSDLLTYLLY